MIDHFFFQTTSHFSSTNVIVYRSYLTEQNRNHRVMCSISFSSSVNYATKQRFSRLIFFSIHSEFLHSNRNLTHVNHELHVSCFTSTSFLWFCSSCREYWISRYERDRFSLKAMSQYFAEGVPITSCFFPYKKYNIHFLILGRVDLIHSSLTVHPIHSVHTK